MSSSNPKNTPTDAKDIPKSLTNITAKVYHLLTVTLSNVPPDQKIELVIRDTAGKIYNLLEKELKQMNDFLTQLKRWDENSNTKHKKKSFFSNVFRESEKEPLLDISNLIKDINAWIELFPKLANSEMINSISHLHEITADNDKAAINELHTIVHRFLSEFISFYHDIIQNLDELIQECTLNKIEAMNAKLSHSQVDFKDLEDSQNILTEKFIQMITYTKSIQKDLQALSKLYTDLDRQLKHTEKIKQEKVEAKKLKQQEIEAEKNRKLQEQQALALQKIMASEKEIAAQQQRAMKEKEEKEKELAAKKQREMKEKEEKQKEKERQKALQKEQRQEEDERRRKENVVSEESPFSLNSPTKRKNN